MWTLCWRNGVTENGDIIGGWEQWADKDDIINRSNTLVRECDVAESDIKIFPPEAGKLAIPYDEIED
jgi:hypothetical protein